MKRPVCFIEKRLPAKIIITYHIREDGNIKMQEKSIKTQVPLGLPGGTFNATGF
jgi:hypothetical protein